MEVTYDLAVVGGGPAGCAAAITAARTGLRVLLLEKGRYPRHRVCGEFVSPESHFLLTDLLGQHPILQDATRIDRARMFVDEDCIEFVLPEKGWSISRFALDEALWRNALNLGVDARLNVMVQGVTNRTVCIDGREIAAHTVVNATGRWSNLRRPPVAVAHPRWIGLKAHFSGEKAPPSTDIYFFEGGYCGVQPVAERTLNASAMVRADKANSLEQVFAAHPQLWLRSRAWERVTETSSTSPLIHAKPEPVTDGVINVGDAAAFIDPFTGDGISLALHSGVLAAQCALEGGHSRYSHEYLARFSRAFQTATLTRRLSRAPLGVRRIAALAFRFDVVKNWTLRHTRAH